MGRPPFFGGARKMRGFPMNLSPGLDEPPYPFFTADGKFEFGYNGPPFHPHDGPFFPGHPGGPMPFNAPGKFTFHLALVLCLKVMELNFLQDFSNFTDD